MTKMAPTLPVSAKGSSPLKTRAAINRRQLRTYIISFILSLVILVHIEWAWFKPRLRPFHIERSPDEANLSLQLASSEDRYQTLLRQRAEMIQRFGPNPSNIPSYPRQYELYTLWDFFTPAFNCPHQVERIGTLGVGGKYVCGLDRIASKQNCIIYSFGGLSGETSFEAGLLQRTKFCKIYGYDHMAKSFGPEVTSIDRLRWRTKFRDVFLTGKDAHTSDDPWPHQYSLSTLMYKNGHDFIDLIKIDIEGWEFPALIALLEAYAGRPLPFGQLQLEIHAQDVRFDDFLKWWEALEKAGLRPFFTEPNLVYANINKPTFPDIAEYSFLNIRGENAFTTNLPLI